MFSPENITKLGCDSLFHIYIYIQGQDFNQGQVGL